MRPGEVTGNMSIQRHEPKLVVLVVPAGCASRVAQGGMTYGSNRHLSVPGNAIPAAAPVQVEQ